MDESRLRSVRSDVEAHVEVPDFAGVAERGQRIRRRRAVVAGAAVAVAVAVVTVGVVRSFESDRTLEPIHQPAPVIDPKGATAVLTAPGRPGRPRRLEGRRGGRHARGGDGAGR